MAEVLTASHHNPASPFSSSNPLAHTVPSDSSAIFDGRAAYHHGRSCCAHDVADDDPGDDGMYSTRSSSAPSSPRQSHSNLSRTSSFHSTPPSSVSLNTYQTSAEDDENFLPSYGDDTYPSKQESVVAAESSPLSTSEIASSTTDDGEPSSPAFPHVADDTEAREEPSRQVDYLSHDWREEDIWSSWKHIVSRRKEYGERSRLENASWRTWAKSKNNLKTVSPERLNWLKDCDVTWLYGPLQQGSHGHERNISEPASRMSRSKNNSFLNKKSNLKKRSVSEVMLQKSISSSSLVKQAAAAVQAQRRSSSGSRPPLGRGRSDFGSAIPNAPSAFASTSSSDIHSPETQARRHIRFDTKVEQCIAVDFKETTDEDDSTNSHSSWEQPLNSASSSSEDDMPMMKLRARGSLSRQASRSGSSRNSFSNGETKGIAKLPSTQIKFHADEAEQQAQQPASMFGLPAAWRSSSSALDKSPSQETLRPSKASGHFLLDEPDEGDGEIDWEAGNAHGPDRPRGDGMAAVQRVESGSDLLSSSADTIKPGSHMPTTDDERRDGMRRTPSGMFMPFSEDDDDDENLASAGVFGRVIDTVNTARDIAHVIWNVGWRK